MDRGELIQDLRELAEKAEKQGDPFGLVKGMTAGYKEAIACIKRGKKIDVALDSAINEYSSLRDKLRGKSPDAASKRDLNEVKFLRGKFVALGRARNLITWYKEAEREYRRKCTQALKRADMDGMSERQFGRYVSELLTYQGFQVERIARGSPDLGVIIIAQRNDLEYSIQVKRYTTSRKILRSAVSDAMAGKEHYGCDKAMVITNSYFSKEAKQLARSAGCELVDRDALGKWILAVQSRTQLPQILVSINQATTDELVSLLGIFPDSAWNIINYRKHTGPFMSMEEFKREFPYLIPNLILKRRPININTATAEQLKLLQGIGTVLAQRMIKYREEKGPFSDIKELKQVRGIGKGAFQRLKNLISLKTQPISINTASALALTFLPGINRVRAERMVEYREEKGPFASIEELKRVPGIGEGILRQLKGAITVERRPRRDNGKRTG